MIGDGLLKNEMPIRRDNCLNLGSDHRADLDQQSRTLNKAICGFGNQSLDQLRPPSASMECEVRFVFADVYRQLGHFCGRYVRRIAENVVKLFVCGYCSEQIAVKQLHAIEYVVLLGIMPRDFKCCITHVDGCNLGVRNVFCSTDCQNSATSADISDLDCSICRRMLFDEI